MTVSRIYCTAACWMLLLAGEGEEGGVYRYVTQGRSYKVCKNGRDSKCGLSNYTMYMYIHVHTLLPLCKHKGV